MKELTCIICPRGCNLLVDDNNNVSGNFCPRGAIYAKEEISHPMRSVTTFVRVINRKYTVCSVKTSGSIPKDMVLKAMNEINSIKIKAPIKTGDVLINNLLGLNVNIIATKNID